MHSFLILEKDVEFGRDQILPGIKFGKTSNLAGIKFLDGIKLYVALLLLIKLAATEGTVSKITVWVRVLSRVSRCVAGATEVAF